jgi:Na+-translocating ferredoxin:NAD+ oxidoreductase subunit D
MNQIKELSISRSPHLYAKPSAQWVMLQVIISLLFPTSAAIYFFGWHVLIMLIVGVVTAVLSEYLFQKIARRQSTIKDLSAVITGMLIALSLPVTAPLWTIAVGSIFAIIIVKQIGGGIGRNIFNPAVAARVMLKVFFSPWITNWVLPGEDIVSTATPLEYIGHMTTSLPSEGIPSLTDLFLGVGLGGPIGETSKLMILIGMIYLIIKRVISPNLPIIYLATLALTTSIAGGFQFDYYMTHVLSGTACFAAVYMITDYSSQPLTRDGKLLYALGAGLLTAIIRLLFNFPGGVGIAILIMNALSPAIDRYLAPRIYGHQQRLKKNKAAREKVVIK